MSKIILILSLIQTITFATVEVTSIADYMLNHTTNEGTAGPGFFINTKEFTDVSIIMKQRLGISDIKNITHSQDSTPISINKKDQFNINKKPINTQTFQEKTNSFDPSHRQISSSNKNSFSQIVANHKTKKQPNQTSIAFK